MMDRFIDMLGKLSGRERWLLALLCGGVVPLALWFTWLAPLASARVAALSNLQEARQVSLWVSDRAAEKTLFRAPVASGKRTPIGASGLEQSLIDGNLRDRLSALSDRGDGRLELHFDEIEFTELILWLGASDLQWGYDIASFRFERTNRPGVISASLMLEPRL